MNTKKPQQKCKCEEHVKKLLWLRIKEKARLGWGREDPVEKLNINAELENQSWTLSSHAETVFTPSNSRKTSQQLIIFFSWASQLRTSSLEALHSGKDYE